MALVHCEECGRQISDMALACPGCGFPLSQSLYLPDRTAELESECVGARTGVIETVVSASPGWSVFYVYDSGEDRHPIIAWSIQTQCRQEEKWRSRVVSVAPILLGSGVVSNDHLLESPGCGLLHRVARP